MPRVLIPLPAFDFDPTEVAVPYRVMRERGIEVIFATPDGVPGRPDEMMLSGRELDPWGRVPGVRMFKVLGLLLRADARARDAWRHLSVAPEFLHPLNYGALKASDFEGLMLPGGHRARGMRAFLESEELQGVVADFFDAGKPVGAICHGVVLAARSRSKVYGRSSLFGRKTTALTWKLERTAWSMTRYFGRFWDPHYYRTYLEAEDDAPGAKSVQAEVTATLAKPDDFVDVPAGAENYFRKTSGVFRDSDSDPRPAHIVVDGNYVSARWPGDAFTFARAFCDLVKATSQRQSTSAHPSALPAILGAAIH
jgi:putative intracellular protease/amidase